MTALRRPRLRNLLCFSDNPSCGRHSLSCATPAAFDKPRNTAVSDRGRGVWGHDLEVSVDPVLERRPAGTMPEPGPPPDRPCVHRGVGKFPGRSRRHRESNARTARTLADVSCPVRRRKPTFCRKPRRLMSHIGSKVPSQRVARVDMFDRLARTTAFACGDLAMGSLQFVTLNA
jgi:hypothetical protein